MSVEVEPWGGIAVVWIDGRLTRLFDVQDAWLAWDGRLMRRIVVGQA